MVTGLDKGLSAELGSAVYTPRQLEAVKSKVITSKKEFKSFCDRAGRGSKTKMLVDSV